MCAQQSDQSIKMWHTSCMKSPTYFSLLRVNRSRKMMCQLSGEKNKREKSFFYSQNHSTDTAVIKEDRATKHILGLYRFPSWLRLNPSTLGRFCMKGQSLPWFLLLMYFNLLFVIVSPWLNWKLKKCRGFHALCFAVLFPLLWSYTESSYFLLAFPIQNRHPCLVCFVLLKYNTEGESMWRSIYVSIKVNAKKYSPCAVATAGTQEWMGSKQLIPKNLYFA